MRTSMMIRKLIATIAAASMLGNMSCGRPEKSRLADRNDDASVTVFSVAIDSEGKFQPQQRGSLELTLNGERSIRRGDHEISNGGLGAAIKEVFSGVRKSFAKLTPPAGEPKLSEGRSLNSESAKDRRESADGLSEAGSDGDDQSYREEFSSLEAARQAATAQRGALQTRTTTLTANLQTASGQLAATISATASSHNAAVSHVASKAPLLDPGSAENEPTLTDPNSPNGQKVQAAYRYYKYAQANAHNNKSIGPEASVHLMVSIRETVGHADALFAAGLIEKAEAALKLALAGLDIILDIVPVTSLPKSYFEALTGRSLVNWSKKLTGLERSLALINIAMVGTVGTVKVAGQLSNIVAIAKRITPGEVALAEDAAQLAIRSGLTPAGEREFLKCFDQLLQRARSLGVSGGEKLEVFSAEVANKAYKVINPGHTDPYKWATPVLGAGKMRVDQMIRVHTSDNQPGRWITTMSEVTDEAGSFLPASVIKDRLALSYVPTHVSLVGDTALKETRIGIARAQKEWGAAGGGFQIELMEYIDKTKMKIIGQLQ